MHPLAKSRKSIVCLALLLLFAAYPPIFLTLSPGQGGQGEGAILGEMGREDSILALAVVSAICLFLGTGILFLPAFFLWRRPPPRPLPDEIPWGLLDVTITALAGMSLLPLLVALFPPFQGEEGMETALLVTTVWQGVSVLIILTWLHHVRGAGTTDLGLRREGWRHSALWGPLLFLGCLPLYYGTACVSLLLHLLLTGSAPADHPVAPFLTDPETGRSAFVVTILLAVGVAPILEEIFFRGFLYPALRNLGGPLLAILVVSGLFAAVHPIGHFYPLLLLGAVLAYAYERTGNLVGPILIHSLYNGIQLLLLLLRERMV